MFDKRQSHLAPNIGFKCLWWVATAESIHWEGGVGGEGSGTGRGRGRVGEDK